MTPSLLKDFSIGLAIFLVPVVSFFKPYNLRQLAVFDLYLLIVSLFIVLLALLIFSFFLHFSIARIFKIRPQYIFTLSCFGYSILFVFVPIHTLVSNTFLPRGGATYFTVICLLLTWIFVLAAVLYFKKIAIIFRRSLLIFASINIFIFLISNVIYVGNAWNQQYDTKTPNIDNLFNSENLNSLMPSKESYTQNVYYIILDGMVGLEYAGQYGIIDKIETKTALQQAGLTYIDKTYSSYNITYLTFASIMEVDYPVTEESAKYVNRGPFFPMMMYQGKKTIPLPELVSKSGSEFIWIGNFWGSCMEWVSQPWTCIHSNKVRNLMRLGSTIYFNTPLKSILITWLPSNPFREGGQRNMKYFLDYLKKNKQTNNSKFVFIHQMSPHEPYTVSDNCQSQNYTDMYEGYKASYRCVLQEIVDFMMYISIEDPNSIVVFQADHGWTIPEKIITQEDKIL